MSFYSNLSATAKRLLAKYGQIVTVSRQSGGTFDPITGAVTGDTQTTFTPNVAVFDYETIQVDGKSIQVGDKRLIMESTTAPKIGDIITLSDGDMTCVDFSTLAPGGEVVIYELQIRS